MPEACPRHCKLCALDPETRAAVEEALATEGTRPAWRRFGEPRNIHVSLFHKHAKAKGIRNPNVPETEPEEPPPPPPPVVIPPDALGRATLLRRYIVGVEDTGPDPKPISPDRMIDRFAVTWGLPRGDVRRLLPLAASMAAADAIPPELLRERAVAMLLKVGLRADSDGDHRTAHAVAMSLAKIAGMATPPKPVALPIDIAEITDPDERVGAIVGIMLDGAFTPFTTHAALLRAWRISLADVTALVQQAEARIVEVLGREALRQLRPAGAQAPEEPGSAPVEEPISEEEAEEDLRALVGHALYRRGVSQADRARTEALLFGHVVVEQPDVTLDGSQVDGGGGEGDDEGPAPS